MVGMTQQAGGRVGKIAKDWTIPALGPHLWLHTDKVRTPCTLKHADPRRLR